MERANVQLEVWEKNYKHINITHENTGIPLQLYQN